MKKNISLLLLLVASTHIYAQQQFAFAAPKGIMIYLDNRIPNGVKLSSITLLRKDEKSDFKKLAEVKCAENETEFFKKAKDAARYFPDYTFPPDSILKIVWARAVKYGLLDSVTYWGMHPAVRMALGILYYDTDAKEKTLYSYKIEDRLSAPVSYPFYPKYDEVTLNEYQYDKNGLYIRFQSIGKNTPNAFKVFKYNDSGKAEEVGGQHSKYKVKDTTYYIVIDKNVTAGKIYQYSLVGVDMHGNMSYGSLPVIINLHNFSTVYFKRTTAKRAKDMLGIHLTWSISDISNVESIHIFRSDNYEKGFTEIGVMRATDTSFADETIIPDKIYYYYLQIKDKTGTQTKNSAKFFDYGFDTRKPIPPIITSATGVSNGVRLEIAVPDRFIAGYRVYRSENGSDDYTVVADLVTIHPDSVNAVYYDTGTAMSGRVFYNYRIESENTSHVVSDKSNKMQARPEKSAQVEAPTNLLAYYQDSAINLFWKDMRNDDAFVAGYRLYKRESSGAEGFSLMLPKDSLMEGNRFTDYNYTPGKTYEYEVESVDLFGYSSSGRATAKVSIENTRPPAPVVSAAINLPDGILIEWNRPNVSDLKGYKVYRYQRGKDAVAIAQPGAEATSYLDKTAQSGQLYFYLLTAVNKAGIESTESGEVGVKH
jgi:fibronectin type 3 domain-containing protein